jgi:hypothetical protein
MFLADFRGFKAQMTAEILSAKICDTICENLREIKKKAG